MLMLLAIALSSYTGVILAQNRTAGLTSCENCNLYLLDSEQGSVYSMNIRGGGASKLPIAAVQSPTACAYDPRTETIFVSESGTATQSSTKHLSRLSVNGLLSYKIRLPNRSKPTGLALDFISDLIYYTDSVENVVGIFSMDFRYKKVILYDVPGLKDIALDFYEGRIFMLQESPPGVLGADGTGENLHTIRTFYRSADSITVDPVERMIYWSGASDSIERSNYRGLNSSSLGSPSWGADSYKPLLVDGAYLYYTVDTEVFRMTKSGEATMSLGRPSQDIRMISDITIAKSTLVLTGSNACSINNGECTQMCLPRPGGRMCACGLIWTLSSDGKTCVEATFNEMLLMTDRKKSGLYALDVQTGARFRLGYYSVDGVAGIAWDTKSKSFYWADARYKKLTWGCMDKDRCLKYIHSWTGFEYLEDIAFNPEDNVIYVVDSGNRQILRVSAENKTSETVLNMGFSKPTALALDPIRRYLYWSDTGPDPKIQRVPIDEWEPIEDVINTDLSSPNDLAIDAENGILYWCDGVKQTVEKSTLDGKDRSILLDQPRTYISITIDSKYLYFFELDGSGYVYRINRRTGGDMSTIGDKGLQQVFGMVYVNVRADYIPPHLFPGKESNETTVSSDQDDKTMLYTILAIGIVVPVVVIIAIIAFCVCCCRRNKTKNEQTTTNLDDNLKHHVESNTYDMVPSEKKAPIITKKDLEKEQQIDDNQEKDSPADEESGQDNAVFTEEDTHKNGKLKDRSLLRKSQNEKLEFVRQSRKVPGRTRGFGSTTEEELSEEILKK